MSVRDGPSLANGFYPFAAYFTSARAQASAILAITPSKRMLFSRNLAK
jgi:hypothetical protein